MERSASVDAANPWLGLASFTEETRAYFYGRDDDAAELARRVQRKLLTVLFGQSGHGKTSLLRAGLVPRLRQEGFCPVYVRLDYAPDSPPPAAQIKAAIFEATRAAGTWTKAGSSTSGESLWEFLHHRDDVLKDGAGRPLIPLLIFDQFEEIFTLAQNDDAGRRRAQTFLTELADLVENRPPVELEHRIERDEADAAKFDFARADYRILISLREDYLAHLEGLKGQMPSVTQNRLRLARFTGAQALAAVRAPAPQLVNDEVARAIVRFIAGAEFERAEVEPALLSLVCRELNNARLAQGRAEISADLLAGSRDTILSEFYERSLADQPVGVRAFIEDEMLTDSGHRESIAEERAKKGFAAAGAAADALATFVNRRLLRVEERLDVRRVELTHDVLCDIVKASRDERQARESQAAVERQLAATRSTEAATRVALWRARRVATVCAALAIVAAASAVYGFLSQRRARQAERDALGAAETSRAAQAQALTAAETARAAQARALALAAVAQRAESQAEAARQSEAELRGLAEKRLQSELAARQEAERQASLAERQTSLAERQTSLAERERNRALAAEKSAETEAAVSRAVNDFLRNDLLAQASPEREPDRDITLRAVLDRAAQNIESRFAGQPLIEASIRSTLAATYYSLGEYALTQRHVERALAIYQQQLGAEHPNALMLLGRLVDVHRGLGKYAEAEALGIQAVEMKRRVFGQENPHTLNSMLSLCLVYRAVGKFKEAERLNLEALEIQRRVQGPEHADTQETMRSLGMIYSELGKSEEAEGIFVQTFDLYRKRHGLEHPNTLGVMNNLARVYHERAKLAEAQALYVKVLQLQSRVMGDRHPSTLATRFSLAGVYLDQGKLVDAEAMFAQMLAVQKEVFGAEHPNVAAVISALAQLLQRAGKLGEAEIRHREALAMQSKLLGAEHPSVARTLAQLGRTLLARGKPGQAETIFREAQRISEKSAPEGWERFGAQVLVARSLIEQNKLTEAELIMRAARGGLQRTNAPAAWQAEALKGLIHLYTTSGQSAQVTALKRELDRLVVPPSR